MDSPKYIFVTGGGMSGIGKGVIAASVGAILKEAFKMNVRVMKVDPYLNLNAGDLSPYEHGEVFVTAEGVEADLDIGTYERVLGGGGHNYMTMGQVNKAVLGKIEKGEYLGKTVQVVPHLVDTIIERWKGTEVDHGISIIEIGGTAGDIELAPFLKALKHFRRIEGIYHIHVAAVVEGMGTTREWKTKPLQHSLQLLGLEPDLVVARTKRCLDEQTIEKLKQLTSTPVLVSWNVSNDYEVAKILLKQHILKELEKTFQKVHHPFRREAFDIAPTYDKNYIKVGIITKYFDAQDAHKSLEEALRSVGCYVEYISAEWLENNIKDIPHVLQGYSGLVIAGGFGERGAEGKIAAIGYARTHKQPILGICLGAQLMVVESLRLLPDFRTIHSREFSLNENDEVCTKLTASKTAAGGNMRLGALYTYIHSHTQLFEAYQAAIPQNPLHTVSYASAWERHRHRYEIIPTYIEEYLRDMVVSAFCVKKDALGKDAPLVEAIELKQNVHPFFVGVQFHPEFTSNPRSPHPIFRRFAKIAIEQSGVLIEHEDTK